MKIIKNKIIRAIIIIVSMYAILLIQEKESQHIHESINNPFTWNRDNSWVQLENTFRQARLMDKATLDSSIRILSTVAKNKLKYLEENDIQPNDSLLLSLQEGIFSLAPLVAASNNNAWFIDYYSGVRKAVKRQSITWDISSKTTRNTIYRLLYGMRAAVEEVLLASDTSNFNPVVLVKNEYSSTLSTMILGIKVHSGDLLVSRGGAEVSALISRGNDYPGNFSHVAIIYIDPMDSIPYLIEAHIERGVAVATVEEYIKDKKLRFMVLRPRADLPQLLNDPMLPHKAAEFIYKESLSRHIPYDFKMDFYDSSAMFCSEVCSYAYKNSGIQLWKAISTISSQGMISWLHTFGVENFVTQMPSDLEYDPQLSVVGEWRDKETLFKDHIDNAVIDVLYEKADRGVEIENNIWLLPIVRVLKGYCMTLNLFGKEGMIPEGMSATQALKNNKLVEMHVSLKKKTEESVKVFIEKNGYTPPYWQLIKLAEAADKE